MTLILRNQRMRSNLIYSQRPRRSETKWTAAYCVDIWRRHCVLFLCADYPDVASRVRARDDCTGHVVFRCRHFRSRGLAVTSRRVTLATRRARSCSKAKWDTSNRCVLSFFSASHCELGRPCFAVFYYAAVLLCCITGHACRSLCLFVCLLRFGFEVEKSKIIEKP